MGIFYDLDSVAMAHFTPGLVNITDMRNFYPEPHGDRSLEPEYGVQQSTAHFYGESKNLLNVEKLYSWA